MKQVLIYFAVPAYSQFFHILYKVFDFDVNCNKCIEPALFLNQVNTMALNTDYAIRTGAFEPEKGTAPGEDLSEMKRIAKERYDKVKVGVRELLICIRVKAWE